MSQDKLSVSDQELPDLIKDLEEMISYLERKIERLDHLVHSLDADWKGPAATAYKKLQRDAYMDAARIRQLMTRIEDATKRHGDGLSPAYLELRHRFLSLQRSSADDTEEGHDT
ncbi:WXG100 family type VII secretion target [Streptomyces coffeae]|uniref:WXG100 family type VII secretion target n=1 Tax=Streptomyces coffeae TaxID=621382 RepID=A0ABS1NHB9_9ACTN|nr:WXG100 family type VII secretion target [Streptomyces coffeae]MBL1099360.1 WXG100 family type VII secretion target [Streptomyces coffeae]